MFIVSSFREDHNTKPGIIRIISDEIVQCPLCGGDLDYRNSRLRYLRDLLGEKRLFLLRRFLCALCGKLHTEIPDIMQPYKHYDTETIQGVLDGSDGASACAADNSTIRRWKRDFEEAQPDITQRITAVVTQEADALAPIVTATPTLAHISASAERWLAYVMKLLINNGHRIRTRFAFCPYEAPVKVSAVSDNTGKRGQKNDKTITNSS